ncbi:AMP-binding enzyme [Pseudonocardia ailaonensis]|uniref:AMP-binding enzyme n=1 Tax=Pseudonocardia ailaonensis TaxID=367279 RepID=UPI003CD053E7
MEEVLEQLDEIADVAVIGLPDPERVERICAVVQPAPGPGPGPGPRRPPARRRCAPRRPRPPARWSSRRPRRYRQAGTSSRRRSTQSTRRP